MATRPTLTLTLSLYSIESPDPYVYSGRWDDLEEIAKGINQIWSQADIEFNITCGVAQTPRYASLMLTEYPLAYPGDLNEFIGELSDAANIGSHLTPSKCGIIVAVSQRKLYPGKSV